MMHINTSLFVSLSLISEDVPKIALRGFGFVFFFFLILLGSVANSDTNIITFWRGPMPSYANGTQTFTAPVYRSVICSLPDFYFLDACKHIKKKKTTKKHILEKMQIWGNKRNSGKLWAISILGLLLFLNHTCVVVSYQLTICNHISNTTTPWTSTRLCDLSW